MISFLGRALIAHRRTLIIGLHLLAIPLGYFAAFLLRLEVPIADRYMRIFWMTLPLVLGLRLLTFGFFRLYQGWWRYVGVADLLALLKAITASSVLTLIGLFILGLHHTFPRSILFIDWAVALLMFGGARLAV